MSLETSCSMLLVEGHDLLRLGLRALLEARPGIDVVGEAATIGDALRLVELRRPRLVVVGETLLDGTGVDACRKIAAQAPGVRIVLLAERAEPAARAAALAAGAVDCLGRRMGVAELRRAIVTAADGGQRTGVVPLEPAAAAGRDIMALTTQERRVLALVAQGKTNKEIGVSLGLSEKTVKNYLSHAFEKLQVSRRAQAAVLFTRTGQGESSAWGRGTTARIA